MSEQPEDQQQLVNQDPENQMPQPLKFINPNSYVPVLETITKIFGTDYVDNKNNPIQKYDEEIFYFIINVSINISAMWRNDAYFLRRGWR